MPKKLEEIREIEKYIKSWLLDIDFSTVLCYTDINKISEGICRKLLNLIYGYELKDLGDEKVNFPAVDLGDDTLSKISFQVTSNTTLKKIRDSLDTFKAHKLEKRFTGGIKFLILNGRRNRKSVISEHQDIFEMQRDVIYLPDLIKEISSIYLDDQERFFAIKSFLKSEFGNSDGKGKSVIFSDDHNRIKNYLEIKTKLYADEVNNLVHFTVEKQNSQFSTMLLFEQNFADNAVIIGESGCGKSLVAVSWAMALCKKDMMPVILKIRYSAVSLSVLLEEEIIKYDFASVANFIKACNDSKKTILLVLDGLNECPAETAEIFLSELKEFSLRYHSSFIITTQKLTASIAVLGSQIIKVSKPDSELKTAIASNYSGSASKLKPILDMVSTSLEARMVGEIGVFGVDRISRYSLFELYFRKKLKGIETSGFYLLAAIAHNMSQEISFSISLRETDRILLDSKMDPNLLEQCLGTGILVQDFNRITFSHEMLLSFFTAEGISRFSKDHNEVIEEFNAPKNEEKRLLILGSIENGVSKEKMLDSIADIDLLLQLLDGEAGEFCRLWAEEKFSEILSKMGEEIDGLEFALRAEEHPYAIIKKDSAAQWRNDELVFIDIIIYRIFNGDDTLLEAFFDLTGKMDLHLHLMFVNMKEEADQKKIGIRSSLFDAIYSPLTGSAAALSGLSYFYSCLESGFLSIKTENKISSDAVAKLAGRGGVKTGQFYLLLLLSRFDDRMHVLFNIILNCLSDKWRYLPRRLKVEIAQAIPFCHNNGSQRDQLIEAVTMIKSETTAMDLYLSNALFEALTALGAFESESERYEETVLSEVFEILADPNNEASWEQAAHIFNMQFDDHPYSAAFSNVIARLEDSEKKAFYLAALKFEEEFDLFLSLLILSAEETLGLECCPELVKILEKPLLKGIMPQERMKNHIVVCLILAKYKYNFISLTESRKDKFERLLVALSEIFYWINRRDLDGEYISKKCRPALKMLFDSSSPYLVDSIRFFNSGLRQVHLRNYFHHDIITIESVFAEQILSACRFIMKSQNAMSVSPFKNNPADIYRYAVDQIGLYGNTKDVIFLKLLVNDVSLGRNAVDAIKEIERRSS